MKLFEIVKDFFCSKLQQENKELKQKVDGYQQFVEEIERGKIL